MPRDNTALVIIDVQRAILRGVGGAREGVIARALDDTVARIATLLDRARASGTPVVHVQHDGGPGHRLEAGGEGWLIRPELAPRDDEPVVRKRACDSFFETSLGATLAAREARHLVVAGCMTEFCVDTSCRRAVTLGYDVTLAADGHMTGDAHGLTFAQIIAHHNAVLDGFDAADKAIRVVPIARIDF